MFKIKSATRLALTVGMGCASLVWLAIGLGLIPDPYQYQVENRVDLTKAIAVNVTTFAENKRTSDLAKILDRTVQADQNVVSIGVRRRGKKSYYHTSGPHQTFWKPELTSDPGRQISIEILANKKPWGELEVGFVPVKQSGLMGILGFPFAMIAFIAASMVLLTWAVLGKSFKYLNPSRVVPDRVRSALDTLAEGLVLIDTSGEIAHSNLAFAAIVQRSEEEILGMRLNDFDWSPVDNGPQVRLPWIQCVVEKAKICGEIVQLKSPNHPTRKFVVNCSPILGDKSVLRGLLVSFDDVTAMENKNSELGKLIQTLRHSRDEVERQNEKLNFLASYDPLTKCMNRRAFFGKFEKYWEEAEDNNLSMMMLDIDHFKSVNDNHGHSVGDDVLRATGELLREEVGQRGLVSRYGGEEFVVLTPEADIESCLELAESIRLAIESTPASGVKFTASIGVSSKAFGPMDPQHLLDQADESLYIAKRHGRNQVVRFDERANYVDETETETESEEQEPVAEEIPYSSVTGLLSALSFRCQNTAQHSIRVADLCVAIGEPLMNTRDLYQLEIAALLHDIGKIGVPDSILKKPGPLTEEEWIVMRKHANIGVEIIRSAFATEKIADVIESYNQRLAGRKELHENTNAADRISLAGRIITVCDAFDAMTHDQVYRKAMSEIEAMKELVRNTPKQFDPEVVKHLLNYVRSGHGKRYQRVNVLPEGRSAIAIGQHIQDLYSAIADEDVERLRQVVAELKRDADESSQVSDAAGRLDSAINSNENDLEKVLSLANEVMEVCRSTRKTFVDAAEFVTSNNLADKN